MMDALVVTLLAWICVHTSLHAPDPPRVVSVSTKMMNRMMNAPESVSIRALYNRSEKIVYLREDWDISNVRDRSDLLHELVHHVQNFNKVPAACIMALEEDAFNLQFAWLRDQGVADPSNVVGVNPLFVVLLSRCAEGETGSAG